MSDVLELSNNAFMERGYQEPPVYTVSEVVKMLEDLEMKISSFNVFKTRTRTQGMQEAAFISDIRSIFTKTKEKL